MGRGLQCHAAILFNVNKPRGFSLGDRAELTLMADEVVSLIAQHQFRTLLPSAGS